MKRSPPSSQPSPSTSCSSSSDDHPTTDQPLEQPKRPRKCANSGQCRAKGLPIASISDSNRTKFSRRSSAYRGVTRHRWTGRFEAHLWDKSSYNSIQNKKGKQVYLGAYDSEEDAARTYDLAALKYWGLQTILNFPRENYTKELEEMQNLSKQDYLASLRRRSSGFSRGVSKYRGVAKHHHNGRWEARIGRVFGNKYLYLGTFSSQEEAAKAYDLAAIQYRGRNAVTNFDMSNYIPKEEPQHEENLSYSVEAKPDRVQNEQQEHLLPVSAALAHTSKESELNDTLNHSPVLLMGGLDCDHERKDDPWSFCLNAGGCDPLLAPQVSHIEEEDSNLLNLHLFHNNREEDSNLFDLHFFHNEGEDSYALNPHVFQHEEEDSNLLNLHLFHNSREEDSNLFDLHFFRNEGEDSYALNPHVFQHEQEDSNLFECPVFCNVEDDSNTFNPHALCHEEDSNSFDHLVFCNEEEGDDSNLFDVLNEKAFEDDINLVVEEGTWECLDGVKNGVCKMEEKIDTPCFDSSPSSSSTVTCDLF